MDRQGNLSPAFQIHHENSGPPLTLDRGRNREPAGSAQSGANATPVGANRFHSGSRAAHLVVLIRASKILPDRVNGPSFENPRKLGAGRATSGRRQSAPEGPRVAESGMAGSDRTKGLAGGLWSLCSQNWGSLTRYKRKPFSSRRGNRSAKRSRAATERLGSRRGAVSDVVGI